MNIKLFTVLFSGTRWVYVSAIIENILEAKGILTKEMLGSKGVTAVLTLYYILFCILAFSLVTLTLRSFLNMQVKIGNAELVIIRWLQAHEQSLVYSFWGNIVIGLILIFAIVKPVDLFK